MSSSHSLRTGRAIWLAPVLAISLATAVAFTAAQASDDEPGQETSFVAIVPCRLVDTRPEPAFNVGPRDTPLGPDETYVQQVTGANGDCTVPDEATGVALNVTVVGPTADSFLTVFPADAERPTASNLNFLAGAPPTPNKVDVLLSGEGAVGFYNLAGHVHLVADAVGYYTATTLQEFEALQGAVAGLGSLVAGKADADSVYAKDEVYTQDEVYTKDEIDGRIQRRSLTLPGNALNLPDHPGVGSEEHGLIWDYDDDPSVHLAVARPADWVGDTPVTLRIFFTRTPSAGNVRFLVAPRSFDVGWQTDTLAIGLAMPAHSEAGSNIAREVSIDISALQLSGAWWDISILRLTGGLGDYADPVFVRAVSLDYDATT